MERYYSKTVHTRGFPVCHFTMDRETWSAVAIRRTAARARAETKRRNGG